MALEADLMSLFEKLKMVIAREAKRQAREAHRAANQLELPKVEPASDRKKALRTRVFGHLRPSLMQPETEEIDDVNADQSEQGAG